MPIAKKSSFPSGEAKNSEAFGFLCVRYLAGEDKLGRRYPAAMPPCGLLKTGGNYLFCEFLKHFFVGNRENKKMVVSSIKMM